MEKKFKTNINCSGCIANVSETFNQTFGKEGWEVNTTIPEKVLTIKSKKMTDEAIIETVKSLGYKIEPIKQSA